MDAALAGLLGAFGGAGIGLGGAFKVNADQRRAALLTERQRAFASYLGALYAVVAELRAMPPNQEPDIIERAIDFFSTEATTYVRTRRGLVAMGEAQFGRQDRLANAVARVQLFDMPSDVVQAFDEANAYVEHLGDERTEELKAEWPSIFERLHAAGDLLKPKARPRWRKLMARRNENEIDASSSSSQRDPSA